MVDFTGFKHPVLAVGCQTCLVKPGQWCQRPSEHEASDFHEPRKREADRVFVEQHGEMASIKQTVSGWVIDPNGRKKQART